MLIQQIVNGLTIGSLYALIAMGLALVYGILRIIHVAHAGVYVVGAYAGLYTFLLTHSLLLAVLSSMFFAAVVGIVIQAFVYVPLVKYLPLISLIASIGVFISLEESIRLIFGPYIKSYPAGLFSGEYHIGSVVLSQSQILVIVVSFVSILLI